MKCIRSIIDSASGRTFAALLILALIALGALCVIDAYAALVTLVVAIPFGILTAFSRSKTECHILQLILIVVVILCLIREPILALAAVPVAESVYLLSATYVRLSAKTRQELHEQ